MIFLGDLACPEQKVDSFINCVNNLSISKDEIVVINFEANIVDNPAERKPLTLYNVTDVLGSFKQAKKVIVSLANNHMYDYPQKILETKSILESHGIGVFGLYKNGKIVPYEFVDTDGKQYAFFGHCWRLYTNTNRNKENYVRVTDCKYDEFVSVVSQYVSSHQGVTVYCFMHWNYDMELLPFPMHRKLSKKLIDCGVNAVIGNHSHVPQGYEVYKGKLIAYGLGNFYLPSGYYFEGNLSFPKISQKTYGIRVDMDKCDRIWFETDKKEDGMPIIVTGTDRDIIHDHDYADYIDMDDETYLDYFKKNRTKKFLVPVFIDPWGRSLKLKRGG